MFACCTLAAFGMLRRFKLVQGAVSFVGQAKYLQAFVHPPQRSGF